MQFNLKSLVALVTVCAFLFVGFGYAYNKWQEASQQRGISLAETMRDAAIHQAIAKAAIDSDGRPVRGGPLIDEMYNTYGKLVERTLEAKCVSVSDGDTLYAMIDGEKVHVRLVGVDCSEGDQPFGKEAKQALSDFVLNKTVTICQTGDDRWGALAFVFIDGVNMTEHLIKNGLGWHYKKHSDSKELAKLEKAARSAGVGIWGASELPIAPWDWRSARQKIPQLDKPIERGLPTPLLPGR